MKKVIISASLIMSMLFALGGCAETKPSAAPQTQVPSQAAPTATAATLSGHTLAVYCGAGMSKPFQEIADAFQKQSGCKVEVTYANAGQIQSQINTAKAGDLFIAGSEDELAPIKSAITASKNIVKHVPVIAVKSGNPLKIKTLADLAGNNVRLVLGDQAATPIGKIADKALTDAGVFSKVNIVARTTTAPELFNALTLNQCDAVIIWKENVNTDKAEIIDTAGMEKYIKNVPAASLSYSKDTKALADFLSFLDTDTAKKIWKNYGYETF